MAYKAILFDFDYTLADATPGIVQSWNYTLETLGLPLQSVDAIRHTVGMSLSDAFTALSNVTDEATVKRAAALYVAKGDEVMTASTSLFPDAVDTLTRLRASGLHTGIVTTKLHYRIEEALALHNAGALIDCIVGFDDVSAPKPSPEGVLKATAHFGLTKEDVLFVGDSHFDVNAAANAGIDFAAVLNGTTKKEAFLPLPHVLIADSLTAVADFILSA